MGKQERTTDEKGNLGLLYNILITIGISGELVRCPYRDTQ